MLTAQWETAEEVALRIGKALDCVKSLIAVEYKNSSAVCRFVERDGRKTIEYRKRI